VGIRHADHVAGSALKILALTLPKSGGRSVGIVHSRTQVTELSLGNCWATSRKGILKLFHFTDSVSELFGNGCIIIIIIIIIIMD
jgi:hypothetical protein